MNALGRLKFHFDNDHDVYMHDTPDQKAFLHPVRPFSHGCIRLEKPLALAAYLLQDEWDATKLESDAISQEWVRVPEPIPVHIDSISVRATGAGEPRCLADVYLRDQDEVTERAARSRVGTLVHKAHTVADSLKPGGS